MLLKELFSAELTLKLYVYLTLTHMAAYVQ